MSDERQLRDELEKVQSEVLALRRALDKPDSLHRDVRARIEQLRRAREQQRQRLDEARGQAAEAAAELARLQTETAKLTAQLEAALRSERVLVDNAVHSLDPGPGRAGCLGVVMLIGAVFW